MSRFDEAFIESTRDKLSKLDPEQEPLWGSMRPPQMFAHMVTAIAYSLGKEEETPNEGGFMGRYIVWPLLSSGIMKLPKNVKAPKMYDAAAPQATLDELMAEAEEFLEKYESNTLPHVPHPYFGDIGPDNWAKLHAVHLDHHMRQFGAA